MNWSYQGTKACTVLVGDNGEAKITDAKNSSSSSATSTLGGRSKQPSSGGRNIQFVDEAHSDVYSRKRRDTSNQHEQHQIVPSSVNVDESSVTLHESGKGDEHDLELGDIFPSYINRDFEETNASPTTQVYGETDLLYSSSTVSKISSLSPSTSQGISRTGSLTHTTQHTSLFPSYSSSSLGTTMSSSNEDVEHTSQTVSETTNEAAESISVDVGNSILNNAATQTATDFTVTSTSNINYEETTTQGNREIKTIFPIEAGASSRVNFHTATTVQQDISGGKSNKRKKSAQDSPTDRSKVLGIVHEDVTVGHLRREYDSSTVIDKLVRQQRYYPDQIQPNYDHEVVEIFQLNEEENSTPYSHMKYNHVDKNKKSFNSKTLTNDIKSNNYRDFSSRLPKKRSNDDLHVIMRGGNDEEFLREFERRFRDRNDINNELPSTESSINPNIIDNNYHKTLHEPHDMDLNIILSSNEPTVNAQAPPVVPVHHTFADRILVNITISTEDLSSSTFRSIYSLSVAVPSNSDANVVSGINISPNQLQMPNELLPPPPEPPISPPPIWAGGECECSCPCMESSSYELDSFSVDDHPTVLDTDTENHGILTTINKNELNIDQGLFDGEFTTERYSLAASQSEDNDDDNDDDDNVTTVLSSSTTDGTSDGYTCATTSIPPEPIILILEGKVNLFSLLSLFFPPYSLTSQLLWVTTLLLPWYL